MAKTLEESSKSIKKGFSNAVKATEKVAETVNKGVDAVTGHTSTTLDELSHIGGSDLVKKANSWIDVGEAGATTATAGNQLIEGVKSGNLRGITDAMAKGAKSVNSLLEQLHNLVPGFPNKQIPTQITSSISRLKDGQAVYDAAGSMVTALVTDAAGGMSFSSVATLMSHFDKNWDTFSSKIDAIFQVTPGNGQQAVLESLAKSMFGDNVYNAAGVIKRQIPGVMTGILGVQDAIKQFGGSYRNPIEAATKIRGGVEKMVQSIEKISQSLNNLVKYYQGGGGIAKGTGYPLLNTLGKLGDYKGIKALDTALRVGGGAAAVVGNSGAVTQAIKNKDIKGAVAAVKKTIDDIKKLTKKGKYKAEDHNPSSSGQSGGLNQPANLSSKNQQTDLQEQQQQNDHLSSAQTNSYVCSGATMKCTMGTSQARLTVLPTRTVNLTGMPMANISDHKSFVNLGAFGRCRSMGFPATASATAAAHGKLTPMPCVHNTPVPWMGGKMDHLVKGQPALLKSCKCQCMWGGIISLVTDGQNNTGPADLSRKPAEPFSIQQNNKRARIVVIQPLLPSEVVSMNKGKEGATTQVLQATGKGNSQTTENTPYTEAEKHYQELLNIDTKVIASLPSSWIAAFNRAANNINANYSKGGITSVYSDVELAHNIYKLATNKEAKKLGFNNISYKMPHQVFDIADKVSDFSKKLPTKQFWDSFDTYVPLYTNIDTGAYFSPYYNCVVISMSDKDNINRMKDSDWYKAGLLHHEYGHAYDHSKGWRNDPEFKALYASFKEEVSKSNVEEKLLKYIDENTKYQHWYSLTESLTSDEVEKLMGLSDCLQAASEDHDDVPPGGHSQDYFQSEDKQMAEFIAHMSENYWSGNDLYEKLAPETYKKMRELLGKRWGTSPS